MSTVRLRRLQADYEKVREYVNRHPRLQLIQADGTPPERYQLEYRIRGLRQTADELASVKSHMVEISLPLSYPRMPPQCRMLTPVFHPNIAPQAICIGDHWSPGEPLWSIIARIGEMIAFQSYNTKSPLNGEAARWVDQHLEELPLDPVSMMPDDAVLAAPSPAVVPEPPARPAPTRPPEPVSRPIAAPSPRPFLTPITPEPAPPPPVPRPPVTAEASLKGIVPPAAPDERRVGCPQCGATLRFKPELAGRQVRCLRCRTVFRIPSE
jgi:ubiquitin-protein ligase